MKQASYLVAALLALCVALAAGPAFAQTGDEPKLTPIKEVWDLPAETPVAVEGYITKGLAPNKYILDKDGDQVRVNIDSDAWGGDPTDDKQLIVVYGETSKRGRTVEIEVTKVERK